MSAERAPRHECAVLATDTVFKAEKSDSSPPRRIARTAGGRLSPEHTHDNYTPGSEEPVPGNIFAKLPAKKCGKARLRDVGQGSVCAHAERDYPDDDRY